MNEVVLLHGIKLKLFDGSNEFRIDFYSILTDVNYVLTFCSGLSTFILPRKVHFLECVKRDLITWRTEQTT